jgi:hypothetical protein
LDLAFLFAELNISAMLTLARSLALLCGSVLAFPPGWCCVLGTAPCCGKNVPSEKQPAPPEHKSCCCCKEPARQGRNESTPNPATPVKPCFCEKSPTIPTDVTRFVPDLLVLPFVPLTEFVHIIATEQIKSGVPFATSSPPLHLSHCVWLC